ncbi:MAG: helix-turn-helix domain-containing protein [Prosthecobacter sp.]|uniref:helix-turn-helix domain-containing protein n=1 Tax=Prosthecobacter sp. TaxID=1965333 RepID=UPI003900998E
MSTHGWHFLQGADVTQKAFDEELGRRLAEHRKSLALSQDFLGTMLRRDQTYVSKIEKGKRTLSVYELARWAKALNLTASDVTELVSQGESDVE